MFFKWIKNRLLPIEPKIDTSKKETPPDYHVTKSMNMLCCDCALDMNGAWPSVHYATLRMGKCELCKIVKTVTSVYDWTWPTSTRIHAAVISGFKLNLCNETIESLSKTISNQEEFYVPD